MWKSQGFRLDPARRSRSEAASGEAKVLKWPFFRAIFDVVAVEAASRLTRAGAKVH
jgi:hypothetical protein